ncbi:glycoside hydrolase family 5 protein [Phycisphaerales bacterium AB-hyl4]|uniref:Glycoside hydrolase family 5 protein n=1 Tax=Natronomicrosphaera hydrolytica TaxID=3242702 RepID=A0ABV4U3I7_9BACT
MRHRLLTGVLFVLGSACFALPGAASDMTADHPRVGEVVVHEQLASPEARERWSDAEWARVVDQGPNEETVLRIDVPGAPGAGEDGSVQQDVWGRDIEARARRFELSRSLDVDDLRGWRVNLVARIRTAGVPEPDEPWEGVRLGFNYRTETGRRYNHNLNGLPGDSDWFEARLDGARIPEDGTAATAYVGLMAPAGTMWVDEVRIELVEPPLSYLAAQRDETFEQETIWRGAGIAGGTGARHGWIERFVNDWNMNHVKVWVRFPSPDLPDEAYAEQLESRLQHLDRALDRAKQAGIKVIAQGWLRNEWRDSDRGGTHTVYLDQHALDRFLDTWRLMAERYKGSEGILGYDLLNETVLRVPPAEGFPDYEELIEKTAEMILEIDPDAHFFVQPEEWWGMQAFTILRPVNIENVTYSMHMYAPFALTHQGVGTRQHAGIAYPGEINGVYWDKDMLRKALQPARDFQLAHGVRMEVGEFSCIRWAPDGSAARWLNDVIEIFEEYGWDWTYHAMLDFDGWSVELGEDPDNTDPLDEPGEAKQVLLAGFARNDPSTFNPRPAEQAAVAPGDVVFEADFEGDRPFAGWEGSSRATVDVGYQGGQAMRVHRDVESGEGTVHVRKTLPVEKMRGSRVKLEAMAKADDVAEPAQRHNGVKVMVHIQTPDGSDYPQAGNAHGTFDWRPMQRTIYVPRNATGASLILGLQDTTGTVWFDDVRMTIVDAPK